MTETGAMPIATGESRPITSWFDGGWFNCPWCETANPPEAQQAQQCGNPACWASKYATAASVRADQQRLAVQATEREERRLAAKAHSRRATAVPGRAGGAMRRAGRPPPPNAAPA